MSTTDAPPAATANESLRERKTRRTRRAIHVATVELALEHGLESVTVAQIAEAAGVSSRTFFNYFASKEDAIVGFTTDRALDEDQVTAFIEAPPREGSLSEDIAHLLHEAYVLTFNDDEVAKKRRHLFALHPHLFSRQLERSTVLEEQAAQIVEGRMERWGIVYDSPEESRDLARMIVRVCVAPLTFSARKLAFHDQQPGEEPMDDLQTGALFERSLRLFLDVLRGPVAGPTDVPTSDTSREGA
ncbi:TetR/AcrR family transcriptional regulator [Brevibacterium litoralis]|uniref:TetR/AcrR family transcriptional regulator n=1 Tax=Brevibacterium litoralis TaxID=3138935 RepID=UPI0032EE93F4